ncbi:DUF3429 domain-containing protein [Neptuniibacter halophilus]|uniref:DUF3429 domain-containing protein n=1 Tax=Neptuniibacter halophilus TaxID=651666 RepID=UPI00257354A7|nr:DUF3429 domain-containing protein [Neptuniibacter halophilus]
MFFADPISRIHQRSGYAGLIPFIGLPVAYQLFGKPLDQWLISYAALIYAFLGGIVWLASLKTDAPKHLSLMAILVMLWGWFWIICPFPFLSQVAGLSFFALWLYEWRFLTSIYPDSFWRLRTQLTVVAGSALIINGFL